VTTLPTEVYLLLVFIIIAAVSLFLCLLNALLLYTLWNRLQDLKRSYPDHRTIRDPGPASGVISPDTHAVHDQDTSGDRDDVSTEIHRLARAYNLDSLVIATMDGLVVASSGSQDPEYDAAHYSSPSPDRIHGSEPGVWIFPAGYGDISLIGIARSGASLSPEVIADLEYDTRSLLSQGI
jgi:hypothetical protein